ncbi:sarcoplasmic reticulum histidine-rich calcium-binding protein-like [Gigantopelta aegis]|uniref:sarcoplasmic reticulum histidine-rich calcium-binding protein-like n=1 Tax=Gigantopelta aegis TaxID=1735272 RepID=UPI001B887840|nr:sarcoplasmic reticulum histidine-rich calcium-binding protein-like [Gigantopelta aegis]
MASYNAKLVFVLLAVVIVCKAEDSVSSQEEPVAEKKEVDLDYAKGSVCGYCTYCKFCKLCDEDCPCETSASKPNCKMCKYCKYCYLCSAVCDTVCKPGGVIDKVSSAIINALPVADKDGIDEDINSVKGWINRDEL